MYGEIDLEGSQGNFLDKWEYSVSWHGGRAHGVQMVPNLNFSVARWCESDIYSVKPYIEF